MSITVSVSRSRSSGRASRFLSIRAIAGIDLRLAVEMRDDDAEPHVVARRVRGDERARVETGRRQRAQAKEQHAVVQQRPERQRQIDLRPSLEREAMLRQPLRRLAEAMDADA